MKEKGCLFYIVVLISWPISLPILIIKKLINDIKVDQNIKKMDKIYNKRFCPFMNRYCVYTYCEFWNNQTESCEIKNTK